MELNEAMYWDEVDRLARAALEMERTTGQDAEDALMEAIDAHRWVIYTYYALQVMIYCENYDDDLVAEADLSTVWREQGLSGVASTIAYACLLGDARDRLAQLRERQAVDA